MERKPVQISFDELNRIRLLDAEQAKQTEALAEESNNFVNKLDQFEKTVENLVSLLSAQSKKIEHEKMLAIGQRNRTAIEVDTRKSKQEELQSLIQQKQNELDRERVLHESLRKVEHGQRLMIDKITKGE